MSEADNIVCSRHGETPATFVCTHVARGVACGFHASVDDPADQWPDAWCDRCDDLLVASRGKWTDEATKQANIQLRCTGCYEAARTRNRTVPPFARGEATGLTDAESAALVQHAVQHCKRHQEASDQKWRGMARWDYDGSHRTITFSDPDRPSVVGDVRHVGSLSTTTNTFQWAWETLDHDVSVEALRAFGEVRGMSKLVTACWPATDIDAWAMTSLAYYLLGGDFVYRAPMKHLLWFMLLTWKT
jgi:hypothetical protein